MPKTRLVKRNSKREHSELLLSINAREAEALAEIIKNPLVQIGNVRFVLKRKGLVILDKVTCKTCGHSITVCALTDRGKQIFEFAKKLGGK